MEKLLKSLSDLSENLISVAKSLKDGNSDGAITELEKTAETLVKTQTEANELLKETQEEVDAPEEVIEEAPNGEEEVIVEGEEVEKVSLEVTKTQAEALTKFADMYISWDNIGKLLQALANSWADVEAIFKTVAKNEEAIAKLSKITKSNQITKTVNTAPSDVWGSLDM